VNQLIEIKDIAQLILTIRGAKVMMDRDLAKFYDVQTKRWNEQVKRNKARFPADFVFQLNDTEKSGVVANCDHLKSLQFARSADLRLKEASEWINRSVSGSRRLVLVLIRRF
jgi:ORF6N domain